jgi:hypothetical protein
MADQSVVADIFDRSPLFEIASVLVRFYHVASVIVNANHSIMFAEACVA